METLWIAFYLYSAWMLIVSTINIYCIWCIGNLEVKNKELTEIILDLNKYVMETRLELNKLRKKLE